MSQVWALVTSSATPGVGVLIDYARWRTLEVVGAVVLFGIALSVVLALVSGTTKAVLLEGALSTGVFGVLCLLSLTWQRPLLFRFIQAFYGGAHTDEGRSLDESYVSFEQARAFFRTVTAVWGLAYLAEAAAKAVVVQFVSTAIALTLNRVVPAAVFVVLFAWTYRWGMRLRSQQAEAGSF